MNASLLPPEDKDLLAVAISNVASAFSQRYGQRCADFFMKNETITPAENRQWHDIYHMLKDSVRDLAK